MKAFIIDGVVETEEDYTEDAFFDSFIEYIESKKFSFGGSVHPCKEFDTIEFLKDEIKKTEQQLEYLKTELANKIIENGN